MTTPRPLLPIRIPLRSLLLPVRFADAGDVKVPAGGQLVLRHSIFFHRGDEKTARVADHYRAYAAGH